MSLQNLRSELVRIWRWGLRPGSAGALAFAVGCFVVASGVHVAFRFVRPDLAAYSTYYAAVFLSTIVGGIWSGVVVLLLGALAAWFFFEPTFLLLQPPLSDKIAGLFLYTLSCFVIIWGAESYRRVVRRLDEEEHYRRLVVNELHHRIKNKFATVHAVLGHELRAHADVWGRISGRLKALAAADEFLVNSDGDNAAITDILVAELTPYDHARVTYQGEQIRLPAKLAAMLALVFHELTTNAAKYGGLSSPTGRVRVAWSANGPLLRISWIETGGPQVVPPSRVGFGTRIFRHALDPFHGVIEANYRPSGLECSITCELPKGSVVSGSAVRPSSSSRSANEGAEVISDRAAG
jgi:two-component sensor histidine kinase